jgi:hypothetical protein
VTEAAPPKAGALYWIVLLLFALGVVFAITLVRYSISGVPMRTFFMMAALGLLALGAPYALVDAARDLKRILWVVAAFMVLGIVTSIFAGEGPGLITRQVIEIHIQAVISLLVVRCLVREMGVKPVLRTFLFAWALSAAFAIPQGFGLNFAWEARERLGEIMHVKIAYLGRERALGLSLTPIHLATQTCLALCAFYGLRLYETAGAILRRVDPKLIAMIFVCALVCIASGNRSPLLGIGLFSFVYLWKASRRLFMLAVPVLLVIGVGTLAMMPLLERAGVRVAQTDDSSSEGRSTLRYLGMRLLEANPLGYGLGFDSVELANPYIDEVIHMENPNAIRRHALHNYYLMTLNKYGILVLLVLFIAAPKTRNEFLCWVGFLPYMVHIFFHNDGPFQGDFFIWYILPALVTVLAVMDRNQVSPVETRRWTRVYRKQNPLSA